MKQIIYIYGYIVSEEEKWSPDEPAFSLKDLNNVLDNLSEDVTELEVRINSGGGLVHEGFAIADKLITSGLKVTTIAEGMVASIASIIYLAGSVRKIYENSKIFIHNPNWTSFMDTLEADDAERLAASLRSAEGEILNYYEKHTEASRDELQNLMKDATELSANKAKQLGFVTEIIESKVTAMRQFKIAAAISPKTLINNKQESMDAKEQKSWFEKIEAKIDKLFKPKNVDSVDTDKGVVWYDGELGEGTALFQDEAMSDPVGDGTYIIGNQAYIVSEGVVTAIEEVSADEMENLKTENDELKAKIEELTNSVEAKSAEYTKLENSLKSVKTEFTNFKNEILGEEAPTPEPKKDKVEKATSHPLDGLAVKASKELSRIGSNRMKLTKN
jgi:ATP-dependent Clp protease protease subunit